MLQSTSRWFQYLFAYPFMYLLHMPHMTTMSVFGAHWFTSLHQMGWNVNNLRETQDLQSQLIGVYLCCCCGWGLLRFGKGIWWEKCGATFSRPTTSLSPVCPHPPILHSFPQSLSTFFRYGWQKSKGYGQCRTFFCLLGEGKEVESPLQCMMYEQQIYIHHGHGNCGLYQLSISQYIKESYTKVKS